MFKKKNNDVLLGRLLMSMESTDEEYKSFSFSAKGLNTKDLDLHFKNITALLEEYFTKAAKRK